MIVRSLLAVQFRRPMARGLNLPFLVLAQAHGGGERSVIVVKCRAGYADRPDAILKEFFALLLARELGLTAPEPVWIERRAGFDWAAADYPKYAELIRASVGWNLGTVHLGDGWKPWMRGSAPRSISNETLETAYAFDAMVENPDRMEENPNLLWREESLAVLDFDKAFGWLRVLEHEKRPWLKALERQTLARHCLHRHLPRVDDGAILGRALWASFEEWWQGSPSGRLSGEVASRLADPDLDLPRLEGHLRKIAVAADEFFRFLTDVSRP